MLMVRAGVYRRSKILSRVFICLLCVLANVCVGADIYVVQHGDSVFTIAQKLGVPSRALAERNGLSHNQHIYPGQRLAVPKNASASLKRKPAVAPLSPSVANAIQSARVRKGRWQYIVIHHSAVDVGNVASMEQYHRYVRHMENGLAYHFVIGNGNGMEDGAVTPSRRWTEQMDGGHLASDTMNQVALGICLVGNFDETLPTRKQMESLRSLTLALMKRCGLPASAVKSHQQINIISTRCPGSRFPFNAFMRGLK